MSETKIKRRQRQVDVTLTSVAASATTLRLDDMAGAVISLPTISTSASSLQLYGSTTEDGTYGRVYGSDGSAADITLTPSSTLPTIYSLPDALFALPFARVVSGDTHTESVVGTVAFKS